MKRKIIYPGAIPLETDLLDTNKSTMIALGKLIAAVFGTATFASGLACVPTAPTSLSVSVGAGEIYALQNIDGNAYSSIAADTAHQVMKQGIRFDASTLACPAPATASNSINYLIQAAFSEVDTDAVVLPYYNASNPSQAYSGPNNAGTTNNTTRDGTVALVAKAGVSAVTGSQITPAPDAGYVGLWVVTVATGQASIGAGNISQYASAPFIGNAAFLNAPNAFAVSPSLPTPSQFDATTKAATMAALQRALGNYRSIIGVNANISLTSDNIGQSVIVNSPNVTITLPPTAGIPSGSAISFSCAQNTTIVTGSVGNIFTGSIAPSASMTLGLGDTITLVCVGSATAGAAWYCVSGTGNLKYSAAFASGENFQWLPGGKLRQWGSVTLAGTSTLAIVNLPISYPNGISNFRANDSGNTCWGVGCGGVNNSQIRVFASPYSTNSGSLIAKNGEAVIYWETIGN